MSEQIPSKPFTMRDALLTKRAVIAANTFTAPIDLGEITPLGARLEDYEILVEAEQSAAAALPASTSVSFTIQFSATETFSQMSDYTSNLWKQTGSANGAEPLEFTFRVPSKSPRFVRLGFATTGTIGTITANASISVLG
jgi:hypothetical protein